MNNNKFLRHLKLLINYKLKINKIIKDIPLNLVFISNINKKFTTIIKKMNKNNLITNDAVKPSLVKALLKDIRIKPFWNDKIQKISDKLFMPNQDNLNPI